VHDIVINNERIGRLLATCADIPWFDGMATIARVRDKEILGGVLFTDYTGSSICIHVHAFDKRWINKDMLWVTFHYPFIQLGVTTLFGKVEAANKHALDFDLKLGFKEVAIIPDVFPSGAMVVLSMCRHSCRWLSLTPKHLRAGNGVYRGTEAGAGALPGAE